MTPPQDHDASLPVMLERAMDMLDFALLLITPEGRVDYHNRAATLLLRQGSGGLTLADGLLQGRPERLRYAILRAVRVACAELKPSGLCLSRPGTPPERWLRVVVAPIYFGAPGEGASRAALWILDNESPGLPSEQLLWALFGLSRAEARLALGVLMGRSAAEYARLAGVGVATVRSQLHSIFTKTGVRRQAQLVALLSRVPALQFPWAA